MKLKSLVCSAFIMFLIGCAPELTEQDVREAYKDDFYVKGEIKLQEQEIIHQWEASIVINIMRVKSTFDL